MCLGTTTHTSSKNKRESEGIRVAKSQNVVKGKKEDKKGEKRILLSQGSDQIWEKTVEKKLD